MGRDRERVSQADSWQNMMPDMGLDLTPLRSQPEPKPRLRCLPYVSQVTLAFFTHGISCVPDGAVSVLTHSYTHT